MRQRLIVLDAELESQTKHRRTTKLTCRGRITVSRDIKLLQRPRQVSLVVSQQGDS